MERFRLSGCDPQSRQSRGGQNYYDLMWLPRSAGDDCLWGNMPFSKSTAILLACRALRITHIVESGRMGGISLLHYHHFGIRLTSIELSPIPDVSAALRRRIPSIDQLDLRDGNGLRLVPKAVHQILSADPNARVAVIVDGPKGRGGIHLSKLVLPLVSLVVLDDQAVSAGSWPAFHTSHPQWRSALPMARDARLVDSTAAADFFHEEDRATILLGARWRPPHLGELLCERNRR